MSRRSMSRRARQERKKTLRVLLGLGLTSSAFAAVAGTIAWTWVPQIGNWTLSPQQDFAEYANDSGSRPGRAWVPPEMPGVLPWDKFKPTETAGLTEPQSEESTTQVASVETKDDSSSGHGPVNYDDQDQNQSGGVTGILTTGNSGQSNGGSGSGGSWNGTLNPNPPGIRPAGISSNSGGSDTGGTSNPPTCGKDQHWEPNAKSCVANDQTDKGGKGGDGDTPHTSSITTPTTDDTTTGDGTTGDGTTGDGTTGDRTTGDGTTGDGTTGDGTTGDGDHPPPSLVRLEEATAIPEPGMLALLASGLLGLGLTIRRRAKR